jgi:hypothetical protein
MVKPFVAKCVAKSITNGGCYEVRPIKAIMFM